MQRSVRPVLNRSITTNTAMDAYFKSCYLHLDCTISDQASLKRAVEKLTAFDVGCLITTDAEGKVLGRVILCCI